MNKNDVLNYFKSQDELFAGVNSLVDKLKELEEDDDFYCISELPASYEYLVGIELRSGFIETTWSDTDPYDSFMDSKTTLNIPLEWFNMDIEEVKEVYEAEFRNKALYDSKQSVKGYALAMLHELDNEDMKFPDGYDKEDFEVVLDFLATSPNFL